MFKDDFIQQLNHEMYHHFYAVNPQKNPIAQTKTFFPVKSWFYLFEQYSLFSKNISHFLLKAFYGLSYAGWKGMQEEILQNISEELNICKTDGSVRVPHYILLAKGFKDAGVDIRSVAPFGATQRFIESILAIMEDVHPSVVAGGAYALESSAVPELDMVYSWVEHTFKLINKPVPKKITTFFKTHVDEIEIGHEARLREVCRNYIQDCENIQKFQHGFRSIITIMDQWWEGLCQEMKSFETQKRA